MFYFFMSTYMIHKIQTSEGTSVTLEVKDQKGEHCLYISKGGLSLIFNQQQTNQLNTIVQSIDTAKYILKEYGSFKKWSELFKISISAFRGIKSFQIREWIQSANYSGFGKQGISLPTYKIKELQMHLAMILEEFDKQG